MSENRRQLLKDAMDNKETYRIPMGFWHHFVLGKDQLQGLERPELLDKIVDCLLYTSSSRREEDHC